MKNVIFALAFMLMGTFAFANSNINNDKISNDYLCETHNLNHNLEDLTDLLNVNTSVENLLRKNSLRKATCEIEIDVIDEESGQTVGTIHINVEVSGGSAASQQSACDWIGLVLTAMLN